jgi:hypothetical protein
MDYKALMHIGNTFFSLRLTNDDDPRPVVKKDAEHLAHQLGADLIYLDDEPTES